MSLFNNLELVSVLNSIVLVILSIGFVFLAIAYGRMKKENSHLFKQLGSINKDLAGLCSAAVNVDSRLSEESEQLNDLYRRVDEDNEIASTSTHHNIGNESPVMYRDDDSSKPAYKGVIEKVQEGASEKKLIKECGLSREEAALLIKLHG